MRWPSRFYRLVIRALWEVGNGDILPQAVECTEYMFPTSFGSDFTMSCFRFGIRPISPTSPEKQRF